MLQFIMERMNFKLFNYINDLIGIETPEKSLPAFEYLARLLNSLGIHEATKRNVFLLLNKKYLVTC